jgi:predicted peptidase
VPTRTLRAAALLGLVASLLLSACSAMAPCKMERHVFTRTYPCTCKSRAYDLYVALPRGYHDPARAGERWPMLLYLPGTLTHGTNACKPIRGGPPEEIEKGRELPMVLVMPVTPSFLELWTPDLLAEIVDHTLATWRIDPDRVIVSGVSLGGKCAWDFAQARPEKVAGIVPVAGWGTPWGIRNMVDVPVWAFHGGIDFAIPPPFHSRMVKALCCAGGKPRYTVIPWGFHWIWDPVYARDDLYEWMLAQRKAPR